MEILVHDGAAAAEHRTGVLEVWRAAFGPVDEAEWTHEVFDRHRARAGYRLVTATDGVASDGSEDGDRLVGFAWGYTGERGQYWSDLVAETLGDTVADWVGGHFELVELAVAPGTRRAGTGRRLHDAALAGLPHQRALLGTSADPDDPAVRLYTSAGWRRLGLLRPDTQVMGLHLPYAR